MLKKARWMLVLVLALSILMVQAQDDDTEEIESLILADFQEEELFLGADPDGPQIGFVPWGGTIALDLAAAEGDLALPKDAEAAEDSTVLQVSYNIVQFGGFTHAFSEDEETWTTQDWSDYTALDFWLYGADSGAEIQVEIFDNRAEGSTSDTAERWFYRIVDDFTGWQFFSIPFEYFQRRADWQPSGAPFDDLGLTEVHGYAFGFPIGGEFVNYIDNVAISTRDGNVEPPPGVTVVTDEQGDEGDTVVVETEPIELPDYDADGEWELVWSDEFEAEAGEPINSEFWTCEVGGWGWGNNQLEHNTDRVENVVHDGEGHLRIIAREEEYQGNDYTSGRCNTKDKVEFTYGRVEARIDLPTGQGIWPAFWMLGADFPEVDWPNSGEIDIMEYIGHETRSVHGTVHGPEYFGSGGLGARYLHDGPITEDFHVFGIEWEPDIIRWTVNGEVYHELTPEFLFGGTWVFDKDYFMLINVAVGGNWPGNPNSTTEFPQEMLVDWVRIYQRTTP